VITHDTYNVKESTKDGFPFFTISNPSNGNWIELQFSCRDNNAIKKELQKAFKLLDEKASI
jgi:hypothetical protein